MEHMLDLQQFSEALAISPATGRNWIKLGKICPTVETGGKYYFSEQYKEEVISKIRMEKNSSLKSRRNKKYVSGNRLYKEYLDEGSPNIRVVEQLLSCFDDRTPDESEIRDVLAECAGQLINQVFPLDQGKYTKLLQELKGCGEDISRNLTMSPRVAYKYKRGEDLLGFLYISLKNMGERKTAGMYYTSAMLVKKAVSGLKIQEGEQKKILDPCCGTGNFLLQLPEGIEPQQIFGYDTDPISIAVARINLILKYEIADISIAYQNIQQRDFLKTESEAAFDYIIGNPPWGFAFSKEDKMELRQSFRSATGNKIESYDVFVEHAVRFTKEKGNIAFILPEALLTVEAHKEIRKVIREYTMINSVEYLGNVFEGVQCPCMILQLEKGKRTFSNIRIGGIYGDYHICKERVPDEDFLDLHSTDEEYALLEKLSKMGNAVYLKNQADFALGIVTGDNKKHLEIHKTNENEPVYKGADIDRYTYKKAENFMVFRPDQFQQTAPERYYRAEEKLLYRFIGGKLIFVYDDQQRLSLNSCNIVIPHIPGLCIKYVLAVLNSRTAQYFFAHRFHSVKILRKHLERIPIPRTEQNQQAEIEKLVDRLMESGDKDEQQRYYDLIDQMIGKYYHLTEEEYKKVCEDSSS